MRGVWLENSMVVCCEYLFCLSIKNELNAINKRKKKEYPHYCLDKTNRYKLKNNAAQKECQSMMTCYLSTYLSHSIYIHLSVDLSISLWRGLWCNGYRHRKWTRRHEFKSWTRLTAFHIALSMGKVWIQLFSLQLWVNSRAD